MHLPARAGSHPSPSPLIQLALDPDSPRGQRLGQNHHLWRNGRLWWIAYTLIHDGWRQERVRHSLGTDDLAEARLRRDRILEHWRFASRAPAPAAVRQFGIALGSCEAGLIPRQAACDR